jgi:hypothetical protein
MTSRPVQVHTADLQTSGSNFEKAAGAIAEAAADVRRTSVSGGSTGLAFRGVGERYAEAIDKLATNVQQFGMKGETVSRKFTNTAQDIDANEQHNKARFQGMGVD